MRRRTVLRRAAVGATAALAGCIGRGSTGDPADESHTTDDGGDATTGRTTTPHGQEYRGRAMPLAGGFHCENGPSGTSVGVVFVIDDQKYHLIGDAAPEFDDFASVSSRGECATVVGHTETPTTSADDDCQFTFRSMPRLVADEYRPDTQDDCEL